MNLSIVLKWVQITLFTHKSKFKVNYAITTYGEGNVNNNKHNISSKYKG